MKLRLYATSADTIYVEIRQAAFAQNVAIRDS